MTLERLSREMESIMSYDGDPQSIGAEDSLEGVTDALDEAGLETEDEMEKRFPEGLKRAEHLRVKRPGSY
jgi:hypothetical protein